MASIVDTDWELANVTQSALNACVEELLISDGTNDPQLVGDWAAYVLLTDYNTQHTHASASAMGARVTALLADAEFVTNCRDTITVLLADGGELTASC